MLIPNDNDSKEATQQQPPAPLLRKSNEARQNATRVRTIYQLLYIRDLTGLSQVAADAPPPYHDLDPHHTSIVSEGSTQAVTAGDVPIPKANNYLVVERQYEGIKNGAYAIDPYMHVPAILMPPLDEGEKTDNDRKNLRIQSEYGSVSLDLWVVGQPRPGEPSKKAQLLIKHQYAKMSIRMHASPPLSSGAPLYSLSIDHKYAPLSVKLPRSFCGPIKITSTYSPLKLSDEFAKHSRTFHEVGGTRTMFVGDMDGLTDEGTWEGSEVIISVQNSAVKMAFEDEERSGSGSKGFWSKVFGS